MLTFVGYISIMGIVTTFWYSREQKRKSIFFVNREQGSRTNDFISNISRRITLFYSPTQISALIKQSGIPMNLSVEAVIFIQIGFGMFFCLILWVLGISVGLKIFGSFRKDCCYRSIWYS